MDSVRSTTSPYPLVRDNAMAHRPSVSGPIPPSISLPDRIERSAESLGTHAAYGAKAAFDFMIGDDLDSVFGRNKSLQQREFGTLSLASNFIPFGKIGSIGLKALERVGFGFARHAIGDGLARSGIDSFLSTARDVGGIYPSFDLRAIEKGLHGTPHTVLQHVAKDDQFLKSRIVDQGKRVASTYTDVESAQRSTDSVIGDPINQVKIQKWIEGGMESNLVLSGRVPGGPIGRTLTRSDVTAGHPSQLASYAKVILKTDAGSPYKYTILTSYPAIR